MTLLTCMTGLMSKSYQYHAYTRVHQEVLEIKQTFEDHTETDKTLQDVWGECKYDGTCCLVYVRLLQYTVCTLCLAQLNVCTPCSQADIK
jgi:hypothetical protein